MKFLREFGLGLVYIILLPVLLAVLLVVGVVMVFVWIVMFFKGCIRFFKGDSFFAPLPEDEQVEKIKAEELRRKTEPENPAPAPAQPAGPSQVYVQNNYYQPQPGQPNGQIPQNPQQNMPPFQQGYPQGYPQQPYGNGIPQQQPYPYGSGIPQQPQYPYGNQGAEQIPDSEPDPETDPSKMIEVNVTEGGEEE